MRHSGLIFISPGPYSEGGARYPSSTRISMLSLTISFSVRLQTVCLYGANFNLLDTKTTEFGELTQNSGYYAVQGHSRS